MNGYGETAGPDGSLRALPGPHRPIAYVFIAGEWPPNGCQPLESSTSDRVPPPPSDDHPGIRHLPEGDSYPKVAGSNPAPATHRKTRDCGSFFCAFSSRSIRACRGSVRPGTRAARA